MLLELTKLPIEWAEPVKLPHTTRFGYRTNSFTRFGLPSMDFVEQFFLVMYWNKQEPMESVVEIRYRTRMDPWQGSGRPIDPKLLKKLLSEMPRYRNALVDIAPGRSFLKGLCGDWVPSLDTYKERTADSLAGSLLVDNGEALAMALSFPGKVKTVSQGMRVFNLVDRIKSGFYVDDEEIRNELSYTSYVITNAGKTILVPKKTIKELIGHSPDKSDSLALACYEVSDPIYRSPTESLNIAMRFAGI